MDINLVTIFFAGIGLIAFFVLSELIFVLVASGKRYFFDEKLNAIRICYKRSIYKPIILVCECFRTGCFFTIITLVGVQVFLHANGGENKMIVFSSWLFLLAIYTITEYHTENDMKKIILLREKKCGKELAMNHGLTEIEIDMKLSETEQNIRSYEKTFLGFKFPKE